MGSYGWPGDRRKGTMRCHPGRINIRRERASAAGKFEPQNAERGIPPAGAGERLDWLAAVWVHCRSDECIRLHTD